jgi:hypothetical protein
MADTFIGYCGKHNRTYQEPEGCPICRWESIACVGASGIIFHLYDDERSWPLNSEGRSPEYASEHVCPGCDRKLVYLAADQIYFCRACLTEYAAREVEA